MEISSSTCQTVRDHPCAWVTPTAALLLDWRTTFRPFPGTKLSVAREGRLVMLESPDGSREATDVVSGSTKYTMADGNVVRIHDNLRVELRPDGSEHTEFVTIDEAGVTVCTYIAKDSSGKTTTTTLTSHGFRVLNYSDGRMVRHNDDGTVMEKLADGTIIQTLADGSRLRKRPNEAVERCIDLALVTIVFPAVFCLHWHLGHYLC